MSSSWARAQVDITIGDCVVTVRDYGAAFPQSLSGRLRNEYGRKYGVFGVQEDRRSQRVGVKAVNNASSEFEARPVRDGEPAPSTFVKGLEQSDRWESGVGEPTVR